MIANQRSVRLTLIFATLLMFLASIQAKADTLFEGWFEVYLGAKKVGFVVERYEFTNKQFKCTYYLKTNAEGSNVTESVKAFSGPDLAPIKYSYTTKVGDDIKVIDATFKGNLETLNINDGKKVRKETKRIEKGTFLSQFLLYLILQQKDGLKVGKDYQYSAIAEEDGSAYRGSAFIKSEDEVKGKKAFKILNKFKGENYFTWVSTKGEPLLTRNSEKNIDVRFSPSMAEATKDIGVNLKDLQFLFGKVPGDTGAMSEPPKADEGEKTEMGAGATEETSETPEQLKEKKEKLFKKRPVKAGKSAGVPAGQGLEIKGVPPPKSGAPATESTGGQDQAQ